MLDPSDLERDLVAVLRPPAKVKSPREAYEQAAQRRFRAAGDVAFKNGWTFRAIARAAHCTVRQVIDCYEGRRNPAGWLFEALPPEGRAESIRQQIARLKGKADAA